MDASEPQDAIPAPAWPRVPNLPPLPREPYTAEIEQGHVFWSITIHHGMLVELDSFFAFTERHAERRARRILARREKAEDRRRAARRIEIGPDGRIAGKGDGRG